MSAKERHPAVLLVEDNDLDAEKVVRAFARLGVERRVRRARNGIEALEILRAHEPEGDLPYAHVVLLDLNMPCMNGLEFLEEIRDDPHLATTPVFVLTTSGREADVAAAHRHHICGYLIKPATMQEMLDTLEVTSGFWDACRLPREAS